MEFLYKFVAGKIKFNPDVNRNSTFDPVYISVYAKDEQEATLKAQSSLERPDWTLVEVIEPQVSASEFLQTQKGLLEELKLFNRREEGDLK